MVQYSVKYLKSSCYHSGNWQDSVPTGPSIQSSRLIKYEPIFGSSFQAWGQTRLTSRRDHCFNENVQLTERSVRRWLRWLQDLLSLLVSLAGCPYSRVLGAYIVNILRSINDNLLLQAHLIIFKKFFINSLRRAVTNGWNMRIYK